MGKLDVIQWSLRSLPSGNDKPPVYTCFGLYPKLYTDNKFIYKGVLVGDALEKPEICVVKARRYKPGTERYWQGEVDLNRYTRDMALSFTDQTLAAKIDVVEQYLAPLHGFTMRDKVCLKMKPKYFRRLLKFEIVLIENAVRQTQIFSDDKVLEAFSHFTFSESNEQSLLHSFRGNKTVDGKYCLLTPEMFTHKYDIHVWFKNHTCNNICGHLNRPVDPESSISDKATESGTDAMYYNFESHMDFKPMNNNENYSHETPKDIPDKQVNFETTFGGKSCDGTYSVVTAVIHNECERKHETIPVESSPCAFRENRAKESDINAETHTLRNILFDKKEDITLEQNSVELSDTTETDHSKEVHRCDLNESDIENKCLQIAVLAKSENDFEPHTLDEVDSTIYYYTPSSNVDTSTLVIRPNPSVPETGHEENDEAIEYINDYGTFLQKRDKPEKNKEALNVSKTTSLEDEIICDSQSINCKHQPSPKDNCMVDALTKSDIDSEERDIEKEPCDKVNSKKEFSEQNSENDCKLIEKESAINTDAVENVCIENDDKNNHPVDKESNNLLISEISSKMLDDNALKKNILLNLNNTENIESNAIHKETSVDSQCIDENFEQNKPIQDKTVEDNGITFLPEQQGKMFEQNRSIQDKTFEDGNIVVMSHQQGENMEQNKLIQDQTVKDNSIAFLPEEQDKILEQNTPIQETVEDDNIEFSSQQQKGNVKTADTNTPDELDEKMQLMSKESPCFENENTTSLETSDYNTQILKEMPREIILVENDIGRDLYETDTTKSEPLKIDNNFDDKEIDRMGDNSCSSKSNDTDFVVKYDLHSFVDINEPNHDPEPPQLGKILEPVTVRSTQCENEKNSEDSPHSPLQRPLHSSLKSGKRKSPKRNVKFADDINNETRTFQEIENQLFHTPPNKSVIAITTPNDENIMLLSNLEENINLKDPNWYSNIPCECCDNENITGRD